MVDVKAGCQDMPGCQTPGWLFLITILSVLEQKSNLEEIIPNIRMVRSELSMISPRFLGISKLTCHWHRMICLVLQRAHGGRSEVQLKLVTCSPWLQICSSAPAMGCAAAKPLGPAIDDSGALGAYELDQIDLRDPESSFDTLTWGPVGPRGARSRFRFGESMGVLVKVGGTRRSQPLPTSIGYGAFQLMVHLEQDATMYGLTFRVGCDCSI